MNIYLGYPSEELANNHRRANQLGLIDLEAKERMRIAETCVDDHAEKNKMKETKIMKLHAKVFSNLFRPVNVVDSL